MDSKPFDIGDYHSEGKCIGSGSFGAVYLGYHRSHPSRQVAIKMMNLRRLMPNNNDEKAYARLAAEIQIQQECDSPYTVRLFQVLSQDGFLYLIMELCWGDLQKLLNENGGKFAEPVCRRLMGHLVRGLRMLRERSIVHRDLKPQNLMISFPDPNNPDPATAELKLADFGFARVLGEAETAETLCGSPLYMAPEILTTMRYDAQADLYSAGAILFHMLAGHAPYPVRSLAEILHIHRTHGAIPVVFPEEMQRNVSPSAISLLEGLLKKQPTERILLTELLVHPWLQLDSDTSSPSPSPSHPGTAAGPPSSSGSVSDSAALTPAEVLQAFQKMESFLPKGYGQPLFESIASLADENLLDTFVSRVLHLVQESREPAELAPPAHISQTLSDLHDEIDRSRKEIEELRERAQRTRIITADLRVGDRAMFYSDKGTYVAYGKHNPRPVLDAISKTRFQDKIASQLVVIGVVEAITEVSGGPGKPPSLLVTLRKA